MNAATCSRLQVKRFFAGLCYANQCIALFEKQLVDLPEKDWATVLLASIIIDNSGLASIRGDILKMVTRCNDDSKHVSNLINEKEDAQYDINAREYWVGVPNQHILKDRAWLYPVIRACDPERTTFTENDYGTQMLRNLSDKLGIKLKTKNDIIMVELRHSLEMISLIIAQPGITGASHAEVENVMRTALTDECFDAVKKASLLKYKDAEGLYFEENEEISKGLVVLAVMTILFAATGLLVGFYYATDANVGGDQRNALVKGETLSRV